MGRVDVKPLSSVPAPGVDVCYVLGCGQHTYNGYTNNMARRLRQHNGELVGGARATSVRGPWEVVAVVTSPSPAFDRHRALSLEWHIRYPTGRRPRPRSITGPAARVASLAGVLSGAKFADLDFEVLVHPGLG